MSGPADPQRPRPLVPQLLLDLVNDPLDPGYAAAAARRASGAPASRPSTRRASALLAVGCLLLGLVLVVAYQRTNRAAPAVQKVHDRLVERVRTAQDDTDALARQASTLETQLDQARAQVLPADGGSDGLLQRELLLAGQTPVAGPGLTVTLTDPTAASATPAAGRAGTVPIGAATTLTDRDVRSVVNELWLDGAEAIAVNDVRLTPTSAIRFAGQAVLVDFQPVTSPYRVEAIGNRDALSVAFAQSAVASRYQTLVGVQGIGFTFTDTASLRLPAATAVTLRYARQAGPR